MKNRGITLIALVITIIVMLILVAVTISMAVNGGLFEYARNATKDTELAKKAEEDLVTLRDNMSNDDLIAKYTGGWYETENGKFTNGKYTVEIGDYIKYNCYNGATTESGFTVNSSPSDLKWQVLGAENGNLLIVSSDSLGNLELRGAEGYQNGVSELNKICAIYGHGENAVSARSIKIEDVNKLTGYDPMHDSINNTGDNEGKPYRYGAVGQYKNGPVTYEKTASNITYTYGNNQTGAYGSSSTKLLNVGATENSTTLTIPESTYYYYANSIVSSDATKFDLLFGDGTNANGKLCWLASSYVLARGGPAHWGMHYVGSSGVSGYCLWNSDDGTDSLTFGVRAVVSLKSDIKLKPTETAHTWDFDTTAD